MRRSLKRMQRKRQLFLGVGLAAAIVAGTLAIPAVAGKHDPGELDRSFAHHGTLVVRDVRDVGNTVAIGREGRIVIAGLSSVMRLLPDGRLDRSFAGDGIWNVPADEFQSSFVSGGASSVAIQRKGGVVVAGSSCVGACDFAVRRLTKRGQVDRSFGDDGMARISFQMADNEGLSLARTRQGKLIVGGIGCTHACDVGLTRLDRDGGLDHSFGRGGKTVTSFGACIQNFGMALDSHNRIVVGYVCPTRTVNLIRFKPDGRVDRSFGDDGRVRTHHVQMRGLGALAVDSHDRIDAAGAGKRGAQVLRYNPSGKLDRSFGNDGIATATYPGLRASDASPSSAAIDSRGRIVLAGDFNGFGFTRLKPGGRVDRSFGRKGRVTIHDPHLNSARSVAIDRRGRIVGVGYQRSGSPRHNHPAAVRLLP